MSRRRGILMVDSERSDPMRLTVRAIGFDLTPALAERVQRRTHLALGRFTLRLGHVHVKLSDVNGPRGGEDKRCHISVLVRGGRDVTIDEVHADMYAAIDMAVGRAAHAVARALDRSSTAA
jgi:ribosome-associated translation inhibitor RaiA